LHNIHLLIPHFLFRVWGKDNAYRKREYALIVPVENSPEYCTLHGLPERGGCAKGEGRPAWFSIQMTSPNMDIYT